MGRYLEIKKVDGRNMIICHKCGYNLSPVNENYKERAINREVHLNNAGAHFPKPEDTRFVLQEFYCPGCSTMLDVDIKQQGEPILWDIQVKI